MNYKCAGYPVPFPKCLAAPDIANGHFTYMPVKVLAGSKQR